MTHKSLLMVTLLMVAVLLSAVSASAAELSGDDILARVDQQEQFLSEGSMITTLQFDNVYSDGTTSGNRLISLSKKGTGDAEYSLIYFVEPDDVAGTIFLSAKAAVEENTHMWLFLPALGMAKELVADQQEQSFAGSTFSYQDVGSRDFEGKYEAVLSGEESITVGEESYDCYVIDLTAKPDSNAEYPFGKMWIEKENFIMLGSEDYNESGVLERTMAITKLGEFEGKVVADKMVSTNTIEKSSTTITFLARTRPDEDIPDSVFEASNLASFDPTAYGL
jgi:outer membrane lipoprotein-sorting protein